MNEQNRDPEYPSLREEIANMDPETSGDRAALTLMADLSLREAREMRANADQRKPQHFDAGWTLSVETKDGIIGLWNCWLKDSFYLGFPSEWGPIDDQIIDDSFGLIDHKPRFRSDYERMVGDWTVPVGGQTVALEVDQHYGTLQHFHIVRGTDLGNYGPPQVAYGWGVGRQASYSVPPHPLENVTEDSGRRVASEKFWRPEKVEYGTEEWETAQAEVYQTLRAGFLMMLCKLASQHGVEAVTAEYGLGLTVVPEVLKAMGFELQWLRGEPGVREGWQNDAVYGKRGSEEVMLVSANSLVPWVCYRRLPATAITPDWLDELALTF